MRRLRAAAVPGVITVCVLAIGEQEQRDKGLTRSVGRMWASGRPTKGIAMIILGIILLVVGFVAHISILWTIGIILLIVGVILAILGATGRVVGGRKVWY